MRCITLLACFVAAVALTTAACSRGSSARPATIDAPSPTIAIAPSPTAVPVTRILFTGDVIPARCTYAKLRDLGDYTAPFQPLHDLLTAADITAGSLDATASDAGTPFGCTPTFSLAAPAAAVAGLKYAGYDVMAHAANHIKDCGISPCGDDAMFQTDANLRAAGIASVGTGIDLRDARKPTVIERNGVYFAFLAYDDIANYYNATEDSAGSAPLDPSTVGQDIGNAHKVANVVIIMPHWGVEYTTAPSERQREFARAAAAAGAEMIVGNHPHWVQAHERIGNMFVAYGLGNFVFDQDWSLETEQGAMLEATFTGATLTSTRYIPIHIYDQYQPRLAEAPEAGAILDRIESASVAVAGQ
jgi:poly-gamma-glutamate capsule biosynthesis protein CapA/YwtB (metallophosphatase superfamily)